MDGRGFILPDDVKRAITDKTILVSVMLANNEIGVLQPVRTLADLKEISRTMAS